MRWGVHLREPPASSEDASERDEDGFLVFSFDVANNDHETSTQYHMKNIQEYHYFKSEYHYRSKQNLEIKQPNTRERAKQEKESGLPHIWTPRRGIRSMASAVRELDLFLRPGFSPSPRTSHLLLTIRPLL
ncbi:hypothetical protein GW17_00009182 [Ensete ventricosum]|nr:hypothetical protein GW17_00009182 [Ensete ventricosum]